LLEVGFRYLEGNELLKRTGLGDGGVQRRYLT
jgi:hypothetical protein